ncbi:MAG: LVIVD repeat-containing protein [Actinomycetota bacterium]
MPPSAGAAQVNKSDNVKLIQNFKYEGGSDLDFSGKYVYAGQLGNDGGVHVLDVSGKKPKKVAFISCPGSQNDVAVVKPGLLALGYHSSTCAAAPGSGVRLIDVKDPKRPRFLGQVQTPGGTHTLTVYPGKPIIYASPGGLANGGGTEQIIDVSNPKKPEVVATFRLNPAGCHDLSFSITKERKLAFCPGLTEIQVWDVSDPLAPLPIGHIANPFMFFPHSAIATPDGQYLVVGDEAFAAHECAAQGPTGSLYVYDITVPSAPLLVGHFGPPRGAEPVGVLEWCTAHNYNFVPGTRILVSAWYTGGTSVIDFANPTLPEEIAYFQPGNADTWSSYWYRGRIYANDLRRGLDVIEVKGLEEGKK